MLLHAIVPALYPYEERQRCTRPTHLTAQCIKQKGRITVHYLKSVSQIYLLNHSISVQ